VDAVMRLDDYLEFLSEDDIRIKGTRVGIETVLDDYLEGASRKRSQPGIAASPWNRSMSPSPTFYATRPR